MHYLEKFQDWEKEFIINNYTDMTYKQITDELNKTNIIKKNEKQVRRKARYLGLSKIDTDVNRQYFSIIDTEAKAYWLGFIYADGWICSSKTGAELGIELNHKDVSHLEKLKKELTSNAKITLQNKSIKIANNTHITHTRTCKIRIYSNQIVADLNKNGIDFNKTYTDTFPIINNSVMFLHFLRGFLDGDGSIFKSGKYYGVKFTNANNLFLKYIQKQIKIFGFDSNLIITNVNRSDLYLKGDKEKFLALLYDGSSVYLDRKYKLFIKAVQLRNQLNN